MNRLSGDIKLLDRQLYMCSYSCLLRAATILSSLVYSIVIVNDILLSLICTLFVVLIILWIGWLCGKLMIHHNSVIASRPSKKVICWPCFSRVNCLLKLGSKYTHTSILVLLLKVHLYLVSKLCSFCWLP